MNKFERMVTLEEAFRMIDGALAGYAVAPQTVSVRDALGRVLMGDQVSRLDMPAFDKSAMDGYAVLSDDVRDEYRVLETVAAGHIGTAKLIPGTAVKVMTGAAVPDGAGRVIMIEHTEELDGFVQVVSHGGAMNICKQGEDVRAGDLVLESGTALRSVEIANLISCGIAEVEVARRPRMAVISTGDEIVDSPDELGPGRIMNSNGPMLAALAREHGLEVVSQEIVQDDPNATTRAIRGAVEESDIVVLSGGVSVGEFDYVLGAFSEIGLEIRFSRLAVQPGKPTVFATAPGKAVFGLPGNPVSVFLMFYLFVLRTTAIMTGRPPGVREFRLKLASDVKRKKAERQAFVPVRLTPEGLVEPVSYHGAAHLAALTCADGFFSVPTGVTELSQGETVVFIAVRWSGLC